MTAKTFKKYLISALKDEYTGSKNYWKMVRMISDEEIKNILKDIAEDEMKHYYALIKIQNKLK